ncbi:hypothetical protein [Streptomyces goshikiensis]|uniref:hypothetical protein n=1 Tax=Streptomyces goshikiensis TaxID=1942 RepID=UPI0036CB1408
MPQHSGILIRSMYHLFESGRKLRSRVGAQPVVRLIQVVPAPFRVFPLFRLGESFLDYGTPKSMSVSEP